MEKQVPSAPPPYSLEPPGHFSSHVPQVGFQQPQFYPGLVDRQEQYLQEQPTYVPATPQIIQPNTVNQTVVVLGGCPSCRVGTLEPDYTCCGILCAIFFFPLGILCCLCMKQKRCTNCNATF